MYIRLFLMVSLLIGFSGLKVANAQDQLYNSEGSGDGTVNLFNSSSEGRAGGPINLKQMLRKPKKNTVPGKVRTSIIPFGFKPSLQSGAGSGSSSRSGAGSGSSGGFGSAGSGSQQQQRAAESKRYSAARAEKRKKLLETSNRSSALNADRRALENNTILQNRSATSTRRSNRSSSASSSAPRTRTVSKAYANRNRSSVSSTPTKVFNNY